jgi:cyclopropane fatty-acyl-phospholipid synthase-like methyltransferase
MTQAARIDPTYVLGRSEVETTRLAQQAELFEPSMRRLFTEAGITTGMTVLDLGSGTGDVAMLAAELVGPTGRVVGVDSNAAIISTARARAGPLACRRSRSPLVISAIWSSDRTSMRW